MKKKSILILTIMVIIALGLNYLAFFGYNMFGYTYNGIFDENKGIKKGIDLAGGSVITFQADSSDPTDDQMNVVETIFKTRLNTAGYTEARISRSAHDKITVEIPSEADTAKVASLLGSMAKLTFVDADGNVILDGENDIKDAQYEYGALSQGGKAENYVRLTFTDEAVSKFADATSAAAARASEGKNYISIKMDDTIIMSPSVREQITSNTCVVSGNMTTESAQELANQIKSGQLPFNLNVISQDYIQ